ncbi:MAG: hypothetical protein WCD79_17625 [Chthoniobacteraceae bacterium]
MIKFFICIWCLLFLLAANVRSQDIGPGVLVPLRAILGNYWKGQVSNEEFTQYVDQALARETDPKRKAEILSRVVDWLPGRTIPNHESSGIELRYSSELAKLSNQPDVVAEALLQKGNAIHDQALKTSGEKRNEKLLSALKTYIECSKVIARNLTQSRMESPSVGAYCIGVDDTDPRASAELIAIKAKHEEEVARRAYADEQNNMLELSRLLNAHAFELWKKESNLSSEEFARIWMEVKTRNFNGDNQS